MLLSTFHLLVLEAGNTHEEQRIDFLDSRVCVLRGSCLHYFSWAVSEGWQQPLPGARLRAHGSQVLEDVPLAVSSLPCKSEVACCTCPGNGTCVAASCRGSH